MKRKFCLCSLLFSILLLSPGAYAADEKTPDQMTDVSISATGQLVQYGGNKAKFNEYRDVQGGFYTGFEVRHFRDGDYVNAEASDIGYHTQRYELEAGKWGNYRVNANYSEIPHHFTFDAKTPYAGAGSGALFYPVHPPGTDANVWNTFDYSTLRQSYGAGLKLDMLKPFFVSAQVNQERKNGIYPIGTAGTSPGGIALELPMPVDWTTNNIMMEAGYARNPYFFSLSYLYSQFTNANNSLAFRNPSTANTAATTDYFTSAPDSNSYKLDLKGAIKLPARSSINFELANSSAYSSAALFPFYVTNAAGPPVGLQQIALNNTTFNGNVETQHYTVIFKTNPLKYLDGKMFYNYYDRRNKSDRILTTDAAAGMPFPYTNNLFDYRKDKYGADLGFKLPLSFYLSGNYTHVDTHRTREDIPRTQDDTYAVELRWSGVEFMVARLGYERLNRSGDFVPPEDLTSVDLWVRRFDAASQQKDTWKVVLDFFPLENLNISIGAKTVDVRYTDAVLGLISQEEQELNFYFDYLIAKRVRLFGNYDYGRVKQEQFQRQIPFGFPATNSPYSATVASGAQLATNWTVQQINQNDAYGIGADVYIVPKKWTLTMSYSNVKSDGYADFTYLAGSLPLPGGRNQDNIDLGHWDDYTLKSFVAKLTYQASPKLSIALGYLYEHYDYGDALIDGYLYTDAGTILSGAYSNPSYRADVYFMTVSYKF